MNEEKVEELITNIIEIEREVIRKKFDMASGLGKKYVKDKTNVDIINKIMTLINSEDSFNEN